jgi:hypothetical protein
MVGWLHVRRRLRRMTPDEFLEWSLDQEDKYELVDGEPVLIGDWIEVDGPHDLHGRREGRA